MALRTGAEFLKSLCDDREVWLEGTRVDVLTHPSLAPCVRAIADVYDLQCDPRYRDALTMPSPTTGEPVSLAYRLPRSTDDLVQRRNMIELLARRSGGAMGRLPEYMATILMGLYNASDILGGVDPAYARRVAEYFEYCREQDLCLTHAFGDPPRSRGHPSEDFEPLHVVERRATGIVIRGVKAVATLAPFANEYVGMTAPRPDLRPEEVLYFGIPVATPGLRIVCREPFTNPDKGDHPLSAAFDEMDAWIVFDDVFVPEDRVFFLDRPDLNTQIFAAVPSAWAYYHILIRQAVKAEVLAGICVGMGEYLGTSKEPFMQNAVAELLGYLETLRAFIFAAERQPQFSALGLAVPLPTYTILGRIYAMENHPRMLQLLREVCGPGLLMSPSAADIASPEIGPAVHRYLVGKDDRAPERFRLLKLAWDLTGDSFGGRQQLFEMYNAGSLALNHARFTSSYDTAPLVHLAKELAGISAPDRLSS
ncbi:MAG TPA: 4-hydroxyphenylacetate 3-hydroxylase N-terminal domain-containing protein [Chloroflexota bacterium]|nr:4-hydroxyphenylacetate 3-hydroxylase N-terminal domain-containing protein [Chloroflexota bacterium]